MTSALLSSPRSILLLGKIQRRIKALDPKLNFTLSNPEDLLNLIQIASSMDDCEPLINELKLEASPSLLSQLGLTESPAAQPRSPT